MLPKIHSFQPTIFLINQVKQIPKNLLFSYRISSNLKMQNKLYLKKKKKS